MDKLTEFLGDALGMIIADLLFAIPVFFIWNNSGLYTVFNCQPMNYFQVVALMVIINLIKPINFNKVHNKQKERDE